MAIRRNSKLAKCIYTSLISHSPSPIRPFKPLHLHQPFPSEGAGVGKYGVISRSLCTATAPKVETKTDATSCANGSHVEPGLSSSVKESGGSSESNSGNQESSGGSHQSKAEWNFRGSKVAWMSLFFVLATGAGLIIYYDEEKKRRIEVINANASKAVSVGKAAIGGSFNLIDHNGKPVTEKDFLGNWTLLYFGFTHCPDICPDELQKLASAIDNIKQKSPFKVVPVFISVDPERDTVEQVREYIKEFHPDLIGLTGSTDEVKNAARAYRVYYMKTEEEGSDYLVDHSIVMYLMDPDMEFVKFFGKNYEVDTLTDGIIEEIKNYKKSQDVSEEIKGWQSWFGKKI